MADWSPPPQRARLDWWAIDLDGTLAKSEWSPETPHAPIGEPIWGNLLKVQKLKAKGKTVVIHTARPWADYEQIQLWCHWHNIPVDHIVCGKLLAAAYIDDRNISIDEEEWG